MSKRKLRVGLIGLGGVAEAHLQAYREVPEVEVVAGAEIRPDRLRSIGASNGIRQYLSAAEMLDNESLDIVCVLTPVNTHRALTELASACGVHVLCEKPIAVTLEDAEAIVRSCESSGTKFFYASCYRFLPALVKARELVQAGVIGDVALLCEFGIGGAGLENYSAMGFDHYPKGGPGGSGMGLVDHGIHLIDIFPWLTGSEIASVIGRLNVAGDSPHPEFMAMTLENGAVGHLIYHQATFSSDLPAEGIFSSGAAWDMLGQPLPAGTWHEQPCNIRIHGSRGSLRVFYYANKIYLRVNGEQRQVAVSGPPAPAHFGSQLRSFARSVLRDEGPAITGADGIRALRALLAVHESWTVQGWVALEAAAGAPRAPDVISA